MKRQFFHTFQPHIHNAAAEIPGGKIQNHSKILGIYAEQTGAAAGRGFRFLALFDDVYIQKSVGHFADGHETQISFGRYVSSRDFFRVCDRQENGFNTFPTDAFQIDIFHSACSRGSFRLICGEIHGDKKYLQK